MNYSENLTQNYNEIETTIESIILTNDTLFISAFVDYQYIEIDINSSFQLFFNCMEDLDNGYNLTSICKEMINTEFINNL